MWDATTHPDYRRATWVNFGYIIFHELTGINVIMQYSNQIFSEMQNDGASITPEQGTFLIGVMQFCSMAIATFYTIGRYGRKTLLFWGHLLIAVAHCSVALFNNIGSSAGTLSMVLFFILSYNNSSGPIAWIYAAETTLDAGLSLCLFTLYFTVYLLSLICPIMMSTDYLGPSPVFFIFAGLSVLGSAFVAVFMKET